MKYIKTETQKFLDRIRAQAKRHAKRKRRAEQKAKKPAASAKDRSKQHGDGFYLSPEWRALRYLALKNCGAVCQCCGARASDGVQLHVDHVLPRSRFPKLALSLENLQVLCVDCNIGKGAWDCTDWRGHWTSI